MKMSAPNTDTVWAEVELTYTVTEKVKAYITVPHGHDPKISTMYKLVKAEAERVSANLISDPKLEWSRRMVDIRFQPVQVLKLYTADEHGQPDEDRAIEFETRSSVSAPA